MQILISGCRLRNCPFAPAQGLDKRFVMFGGGVSEEQLEWLEAELAAAQQARLPFVLLCFLAVG